MDIMYPIRYIESDIATMNDELWNEFISTCRELLILWQVDKNKKTLTMLRIAWLKSIYDEIREYMEE